jgi:hypothetical protein
MSGGKEKVLQSRVKSPFCERGYRDAFFNGEKKYKIPLDTKHKICYNNTIKRRKDLIDYD